MLKKGPAGSFFMLKYKGLGKTTMRKSKQSAAEIEQYEREEAGRVASRKKGFSMMEIRDRGNTTLRNLQGGSVTMHWHVDRELEEGEARRSVPDNIFVLEQNGVTIALDAEEFRKYLRWV